MIKSFHDHPDFTIEQIGNLVIPASFDADPTTPLEPHYRAFEWEDQESPVFGYFYEGRLIGGYYELDVLVTQSWPNLRSNPNGQKNELAGQRMKIRRPLDLRKWRQRKEAAHAQG
jgi:hypothetical protein